jgi:hypothetical protein
MNQLVAQYQEQELLGSGQLSQEFDQMLAVDENSQPAYCSQNEETGQSQGTDNSYSVYTRGTCDSVAKAFYEWAKLAGFKRLRPRKKLTQCSEEYMRRKATSTAQAIELIFEHIGEEDASELKTRVLEQLNDAQGDGLTVHPETAALLRSTARQYRRTVRKQEKRAILSTVANVLSLKILQLFFPRLSRRQYYQVSRFF